MNKLIIVMLAVCLVSAHAFVKRDAPADEPATNMLDQAKAEWDKLGTKIMDGLHGFDSAKFEQDIKKFIDDAGKAMADITKNNEAPKS